MPAEFPNAFLGRLKPPTEAEVAAALGPSADAWNEFIAWMAEEEGVTTKEWKGVIVKKYGWSLRLLHKTRNIVYLSPCEGCFRVGFTLGKKAMNAVREMKFPEAVAEVISTAPKYPEGTGIRLLVRNSSDLPSIRKLAHIKIAN